MVESWAVSVKGDKVETALWTYDDHFLSSCLAESFGPPDLSWVAFHPVNREGAVRCGDGANGGEIYLKFL